MGRLILRTAQVAVTVLFMTQVGRLKEPTFLSFGIPLILIFLVILNSFWFSRATSWLIFSLGFFSFLVVLSAFTIRWRVEPGFSSTPFYQSIIMNVLFIYISLGQLKINQPKVPPSLKEDL